MSQLDDYLAKVQKMDQIAKLMNMGGPDVENDEFILQDLELGMGGLSCSGEALDRAYSRCVHRVVEKRLHPPPPADDMPAPPQNGAYLIAGKEISTQKPCWFLSTDGNAGVACCGTNGCGKTVFLAGLVDCIPPGVFILAPDKKREIIRIGRRLNRRMWYGPPSRLPFNLMSCPTSDPATFYAGLFETFAPIFLGSLIQTWPGAAKALAIIRTALPRDAAMLSYNECVEAIREVARGTHQDKYQTFADCLAIVGQALGASGNIRRAPDIVGRYSLMGIDFSKTSLQVRHVIEYALTYHLMQRQLARGFKQGGVDFAVIEDEGLDSHSKAYDMVSGSGRINFMTDAVNSQGRAFNFTRIFLFQSISQAAENIMWNNRVFVAMRLPDRTEAQKAARRLSLTDDYVPVIMNLPDGEAFISAPGLGRARHMKTDLLDLGGYPSDEDVSVTMADEWKWVEENSEFAAPPEDTSEMATCISEIVKRHNQPPVPVARQPARETPPVTLLGDWAQFLIAVRENPTTSSSGFGRILNWGTYKAARVAKALVADGLLVTTTANTKGRPSIHYQITPKGVESLEAWSSHDKK